MKNKIKLFLIIAITIFIFTVLNSSLLVNAKTYNVPKYDEGTDRPGSGSGLSAPITKFDVFSTDENDDKNYATSKIVNIQVSSTKTFVLDFYTINWYGRYPSQELIFEVEDNEIIDVEYFRDGVSSGSNSIETHNKKISDSNLPDRLVGNKLNPDFPALSFTINGLKSGITCLNILVKSTHQYGLVLNVEEVIRLVVNVSEEPLIEIPNYVNLSIGSGIHSGAGLIKYEDNQVIGILNDIVNSVSIVEPQEVSNFNENSSVKIMHRILTDDKILVQKEDLLFIDTTNDATFTVEYYIVTSTNVEVEVASYSFDLVFYNLSDFKIVYSDTSFYETGLYKAGTKIKIEAVDRLKPYLSHLIVAYTNSSGLNILPYEGDCIYVINKVMEPMAITIIDKLMLLSGLSNYTTLCKYDSLTLTIDNVVENEYPYEIELNDNYSFDFDGSLDELIEIANIDQFNDNAIFNIISDGVINVSLTEDKKIRINYFVERELHYTIRAVLTVEAKLDNGITLQKEVNILLVPAKGYIYTFNTPSLTIVQGESKTVTLGYLDPEFVELISDIYSVNYYLKNNNVIISNETTSNTKFNVYGDKVGQETAYFIVNEQVVELEVNVINKHNSRIEKFNFVEGSSISLLVSNSKTYLTIPEEYAQLDFKYIVYDNDILTINSISNSKITVTGLKDGTTQIFAYAQKDDVFYNALISIKIITSIPKVNIIYENEDSTKSLTKYDNIKISFDASNFDFSSSSVFRWYLNDALIYDNIKEFERRFDEGINTLKLVITDGENNLNIEATQQLMISSVENVEKTISMNTDKTIYVDLHQGSFEINALIDGVLDTYYKFLWSISNSSICKISINGNEKIILEPLYVGEVDLTVMTNISKYEEVFIKSDIKIIVIEPTYTLQGSTFIKPNTDQSFDILGDGKVIYNLKPIVKIQYDGQDFDDYVVNNKNIAMKNVKKGRYVISANINNKDVTLGFEATNFNLRQIAKLVLPYLCVICSFVIVVAVVLKKRKNLLDRINKKIDSLDKTIKKALKDNIITKKEINKILSETINANKMIVYCRDEGIDELSIILPITEQMIKILTATIKADVKEETALIILQNIYNKNINKLKREFLIIKNERNEFEQKKKIEDEVIKRKTAKEHISKEQYQDYINMSKYAEADDDNE